MSLASDGGAVLGTPLCGAIAWLAGYRTMFSSMALASCIGLALVRLDAVRQRTVELSGMEPLGGDR